LSTAGRATGNQVGQRVVLQGIGAGSQVHTDQLGSPGGFNGLVQQVGHGVVTDQVAARTQGIKAVDKLVGVVRIRCGLNAGSRGDATNHVVAKSEVAGHGGFIQPVHLSGVGRIGVGGRYGAKAVVAAGKRTRALQVDAVESVSRGCIGQGDAARSRRGTNDVTRCRTHVNRATCHVHPDHVGSARVAYGKTPKGIALKTGGCPRAHVEVETIERRGLPDFGPGTGSHGCLAAQVIVDELETITGGVVDADQGVFTGGGH